MCHELELLYLAGEKQGIEKNTVSNLISLMATLGLSIEAAMNALEIPENERTTYVDLLAKQ